jgi:predicted GNAT family acetyltransferase
MTAATPAIAVVRNDELSRYEIFVDAQIAGFLDYRLRDGRQVLVHTEISPEFRGRDLAARLVQEALDDARADGYLVVPRCPYVAEFIADHSEYQDLVRA